MEQNLIPALKKELVVSSSSFQSCHPYQISEHARNIHMSNGEKYVQTHPEFRHTVDCCHSKQKHDQELSLVCLFHHLWHQGRWDILPEAFEYVS